MINHINFPSQFVERNHAFETVRTTARQAGNPAPNPRLYDIFLPVNLLGSICLSGEIKLESGWGARSRRIILPRSSSSSSHHFQSWLDWFRNAKELSSVVVEESVRHFSKCTTAFSNSESFSERQKKNRNVSKLQHSLSPHDLPDPYEYKILLSWVALPAGWPPRHEDVKDDNSSNELGDLL